MSIPVAINPQVRSPGLALLVDFFARPAGAGTAALRACILATKGALGTITADTQLATSVTPDSAAKLLGPGTPGHLAIKRCFEEYGFARLDLVAPAEPAADAATQTVVFNDDTPVTATRTVTLDAIGRELTYYWTPGTGKVAAATAFVALINAADDDLPLTASNADGASATVTLTFKLKGKIGNDTPLFLTVSDGAGGTVTLGGATLTGGTGEPVLTTALTTIANQEYDFILPCVSNDDAAAASSTSGPSKVRKHIADHKSGRSAKLQQAIVGLTGTLAAAKTGAAYQDSVDVEYTFANKGRSLPCEFAGAELGQRLRLEQRDPNYNRITTTYVAQLFGAKDLVADTLTEAQEEDALQNGIHPVMYTALGEPRTSRPVTTYFEDSNGNPDDRCLDTNIPSSLYRVARDLRVYLPQEFPNKKLSKDLPPGDEPPEDVVEEREVKAAAIERARYWQKRGVVDGPKLDAAIANGTYIVQVDEDDPRQCDLVLPYGIVPVLAKFSVVVQQG